MVRRLSDTNSDRRARAVVMGAFGLTCISRGAFYLVPSYSGSGDYVQLLIPSIPLVVWAWLWVVAGAAILVGVFSLTIGRASMALGVSLWTAWAVSYLGAMFLLGHERAWGTAALFLMLVVYSLEFMRRMEPPRPPGGER